MLLLFFLLAGLASGSDAVAGVVRKALETDYYDPKLAGLDWSQVRGGSSVGATEGWAYQRGVTDRSEESEGCARDGGGVWTVDSNAATRKMILDLRNNIGGQKSALVRMANRLFQDKVVLGRSVARRGKVTEWKAGGVWARGVAQIGLGLGVVPKDVYAVVVFMSIATTMIAPVMLKMAFRRA